MLIARDIHKSYGNLHVLKGVDLEISTSEIVSIVGSSGAGKSTLLHILGTLDKPDQGTLSMNGKDLIAMKGEGLAQFRNQQIGFIFQFHNLLPEFTALENIQIPSFIQGKNPQQIEKKAGELAEILGISHRLDHKPSTLSGGEQQRVAVARALINSPEVVFADEPSGNLDTSNARALHELFFTLRKELGHSFVIVTHNEELAAMADRKVEMKDGNILS
ncbi:MAG TPA: lipoprotein-releasing system ATP-binding protein LolD [Algoriphagus sp.]|jgi:lipoprotein-releasing system ATP-binding protein|uniref:ABC transporter ATP-binding protein n=1 Tax=Algoriphagus TaxID=246875 RepID=UPI000C36E992|nr:MULTISPECIES: ABC transporter ATP-binding protein [Algoriphagus]MAL13502.1 lipoprotein-releasing system ATP-binding protein LolD [Algoriphagus sp.]MAN85884.1 lipoprotein-releasing system ATP-binding protein LolD [Algoriphagus sp.]QYH38876.1 ABC transporter ATP-binding protein [Algoriphagus sp. NBT04N3]HAH35533.1 lipoprotein-releasing system ATP-binding protein LolD [Algoriphagus sp.]HAS58892.1 lipoprotein-releasing system ATP-binding protein LolD [Algoriphagus sp.]|tara:strand:- start:1458 stop:2111 length:654 start_codon:yes stop_codon:yes gene_type:complete